MAALFATTAPAVMLGVINFEKEQGWECVFVAAAVAAIFLLAIVYQRYMLHEVAGLHRTACEKIHSGGAGRPPAGSSPEA